MLFIRFNGKTHSPQTGGSRDAAGDIVMNAISLDMCKPIGPSLAGNQAKIQRGYPSGPVRTRGNTLTFRFTAVDVLIFLIIIKLLSR